MNGLGSDLRKKWFLFFNHRKHECYVALKKSMKKSLRREILSDFSDISDLSLWLISC